MVEPSPLKNDGLRQLGFSEIPNIWDVIKFHGSKPPTRVLTINIPLLTINIPLLVNGKDHPIYYGK